MNRRLTNTILSPQQAIIIFHDKTKTDFYLESRKIKNVKGSYTLMEATPLSESTLKALAQSYIKQSGVNMEFGGIISSHLLYTLNKPGMNVVMWYRAAMKRHLNFSSQLNIHGNSFVNIPATLYMVVNSNLYIYALMTDDRPDAKTKLYKAPFYNIYEDGRVCLGTAKVGKVKEKTFDQEAERFEKAFYMAEQNGGQSRDNCKTPLAALWTSLIKSKKPFPSKRELIQHPRFKTLSDLINKLIKIKSHEEDYEEDFEEDFETEFGGDLQEINEDEIEVEI